MNKIRVKRKALGLTQTQLAERAGIGRPHLSRIESGRFMPSVRTLMKLAIALCCTVAELI